MENGKNRRKKHKNLEQFYSVDKYPSKDVIAKWTASMELTSGQVQNWLIGRRRKEKRENQIMRCARRNRFAASNIGQSTSNSNDKRRQQKMRSFDERERSGDKKTKGGIGDKSFAWMKDIFPPDYILKRIFRKNGPCLGIEFDPIPTRRFNDPKDSLSCVPVSSVSEKVPKRRKVDKCLNLDYQGQQRKPPGKGYGVGKGLMTLWRVTCPNGGRLPAGITNFNDKVAKVCSTSDHTMPLRPTQVESKTSNRGKHKRRASSKSKSLVKKMPPSRRRKVLVKKKVPPEKSNRAFCELAMEHRSNDSWNAQVILVDDEELELMELQSGSNPLACSLHLGSNGRYDCSLCKDLLEKFPPCDVNMKHPLTTRPWNSSQDTVKKLFKVFHFLYTHATTIGISPFTLDELAHSFSEKNSVLLDKIHITLLRVLFLDVERELSGIFLPGFAKDCRFLVFINSIRNQESAVAFWNSSLNPLTWREILRQVLVAAGYGSRSNFYEETHEKELVIMTKYGLHSGTLKGELFKILFERGSKGARVSELAKASTIVELDLFHSVDELESEICSALSSDITLFEKICTTSYRLRVNPQITREVNFPSDTEDSGCVHDCSSGSSTDSSSSDEDDSAMSSSPSHSISIIRSKCCNSQKLKKMDEYQCSEIDESDMGEAWMLGLLESEYSSLSIEEKLDALVALIGLTGSGYSIHTEVSDNTKSTSERLIDIQYPTHGGKIKKNPAKQHEIPRHFLDTYIPVKESIKGSGKPSSVGYQSPTSKTFQKRKSCHMDNFSIASEEGNDEKASGLHPLQSIYLGSDRRYNKYWLFLGPCNNADPGHRRIYFESSEDGHWEVIESVQALNSLLSVLDKRGIREYHLLASLERLTTFLQCAMTNYEKDISKDVSSPSSDIDNNSNSMDTANNARIVNGTTPINLTNKGEEKKISWEKQQAYDKWIWDSFYSNLSSVKFGKKLYLDTFARCEKCHDLYWKIEKHCKICHSTFELDFDLEERYAIHVATCREIEGVCTFPTHKVLPSELQCLKAATHAIEAVMPQEALVDTWAKSSHNLWVNRLRRTSSITELLQVLTDFVCSMKEDWLCQCGTVDSNTVLEEIILFFPTLPQTTSAISLWLMKLDAMIASYLQKVNLLEIPGNNPKRRGKHVRER